MKTQNNTVIETTLKQDLCINCGLCKVACPVGAITMERNKYGELNPVIDENKCTNCGQCTKYCPHTEEKIKSEALAVSSYDEPQVKGLEDANFYVAWSKDTPQRKECCSGGVVTELAKHLFETGKIDGVVHVERVWAKRGELHYGARLSKSVEEICENVSSAYQPIDFSEILPQLEENKTYFITGTPCVIRGMKKLFATHKRYINISIMTCALVCSHNTSAQFIDFLTEINELCNRHEWQVNIRAKDENNIDANNFNNHIYTKEKDLLNKNRFESGWADIWRGYYFAMNVCNYCSDFWGYEADISVKDAWDKEFTKDPLGKSIVIVRNQELEQELKNCNLEMSELSFEFMKNHQFPTAEYKQIEAKNKNFKSIFSRSNRRNGLFKNVVIAKLSKFLYKNFGFKFSRMILHRVNKILTRKKKKKKVKFPFLNSIKRVFRYKGCETSDKTKKILVAGGYGYGNTGDEAQCSATLKILNTRYPDYQIINLTPNVEYSKSIHPEYNHDFASRALFFDSNKDYGCYNFKNNYKPYSKSFEFFVRFILIYLNAFLVRGNLPTWFINASCTKFLYEMKTCSMFYFCGGGYLTGSTLSRLLDGILLCRLAHIFRIPVVMSGQTIGVWNNSFNKALAKWGFKYVDAITVRDEDFSLADLEKIGLKGENFFPTHDDALFCDKSEEKQVDLDNYVTLNFHYWGMNNDEKSIYINKINRVVNHILSTTDYDIVFIPMHRTDKLSYDDYIKQYPNERLHCFDYDYDFKKVRRVIADSKICVTMKHHPIIFAMGENVPVVSLAFSSYYVHKNLGALSQYGQDEFSLNFEDENWEEQFVNLFGKICSDYDKICDVISDKKVILNERKEKFLKIADELLNKKEK